MEAHVGYIIGATPSNPEGRLLWSRSVAVDMGQHLTAAWLQNLYKDFCFAVQQYTLACRDWDAFQEQVLPRLVNLPLRMATMTALQAEIDQRIEDVAEVYHHMMVSFADTISQELETI
jgi:hypothetical protein